MVDNKSLFINYSDYGVLLWQPNRLRQPASYQNPFNATSNCGFPVSREHPRVKQFLPFNLVFCLHPPQYPSNQAPWTKLFHWMGYCTVFKQWWGTAVSVKRKANVCYSQEISAGIVGFKILRHRVVWLGPWLRHRDLSRLHVPVLSP